VTAEPLTARPLAIERPGLTLAGEASGEGPPIVLAHGLTATRRYVVHGSRALARAGFEQVAYDARGHGESDPAPAGEGYGYDALAGDLGAVVERVAGDGRCVLAGHSMGAHTIAAYALAASQRIAAVVLIGPAYDGKPISPREQEYWARLAAGLERDGVDGFIAAYDHDLDPAWRDVLLRIARDRLGRHRHPEAVAQALRETSSSRPFGALSELEAVDLPALVVASRDEADPGHPYAVAEAWAQRLPRSTLISEEPGASPLAWQGGRLSRAIADFCARDEVVARLA
jgi:pimeloyl-ACP methyl ester carboxylesterase